MPLMMLGGDVRLIAEPCSDSSAIMMVSNCRGLRKASTDLQFWGLLSRLLFWEACVLDNWKACLVSSAFEHLANHLWGSKCFWRLFRNRLGRTDSPCSYAEEVRTQ